MHGSCVRFLPDLCWCQDCFRHCSGTPGHPPGPASVLAQGQKALDIRTSSLTRDVVARLRPLIQPRRNVKSTSPEPPVVRLEDGTLATDEKQALDRCIRHFAWNEGGTTCAPDTLVEAVRSRYSQKHDDPFPLQVGDIPSRCLMAGVIAGLT